MNLPGALGIVVERIDENGKVIEECTADRLGVGADHLA